MENPSPNPAFPKIKRIRQQTDYHCGPAVVVMLASYVDTKIRQHDVIIAANVQKSYRQRGMTISELGKGLKFLCPDLTFWYKNEANIDDLDSLINTHHFPVGIEWQGAFGQYADEDSGHYSVVTAIDRKENIITLSDPFYYFAGTDRIFPIDEFISRWWDNNEVVNPDVPTAILTKDIQSLFLVTKKDHQFPEELHLLAY
jgi:ABC-type bacteriocin/lantibiotic exporter with double-glycine peptidase domain